MQTGELVCTVFKNKCYVTIFAHGMGNFKNDIFGDYIRYTHASCHSYVVVNIDGKILVVNGENDAETKEIYQRISEKVSKERK